MNRKDLVVILCLILLPFYAAADTVIPGGAVSGTWTSAGSPYLVQGNISISSGNALTIEPGVVVEFQGAYSLTVSGLLEAAGTEADSIYFTSAGTWLGMSFQNCQEENVMAFCVVENATFLGAVWFNNSAGTITHCSIRSSATGLNVAGTIYPVVSHCNFTNNNQHLRWSSYGGEISYSTMSYNTGTIPGVFIAANFTIDNCVISYNQSESPGAGIFAQYAHVTFVNCEISHNEGLSYSCRGGGVCINYGTGTFIDCTLSYNHAESLVAPADNAGGGVSLYHSAATFTRCIFNENTGVPRGTAIAASDGSSITMDHCTIDNNTSDLDDTGSITVFSGCTATISNTIISNISDGYAIENYGTLTLSHSNFFNNVLGDIYGNIPAGFATLTTTNANGDSCDVYGNIFMDPIYEDQPNDDFHLDWENWPVPDESRSPCIDAGNPADPFDPDNTITDIGAFCFFQPTLELMITVPSGGESWERGTTHDIEWIDNLPGNVSIELYEDQELIEVITADTESDGVFSWSIPVYGEVGDDFYMRVTYLDLPDLQAESGLFTITEQRPLVSIDLLPMGGDTLYVAANGGTVQFRASITNNTGQILSFDAWTNAQLPNGNFIADLVDVPLTLQPFQSILTQTPQSQYVPGGAPAGEYLYWGYAGLNRPGTLNDYIVDDDSFLIIKLGAATVPVGAAEWIFTGEFFLSGQEDSQVQAPETFSLESVFPNPFNLSTTIQVDLPVVSQLNIAVFNVIGQLVTIVVDGEFEAGQHTFSFDASQYAAGVYFIHVVAPETWHEVRKVMLLK